MGDRKHPTATNFHRSTSNSNSDSNAPAYNRAYTCSSYNIDFQ
jgi:hypothetical protein